MRGPRGLVPEVDRGVVDSLNLWVSDYPDQCLVSRQVVITALRFLDQAGSRRPHPKRDVSLFEPAHRQIVRHIDLPSVLSRIPLLSLLDPAVQRELANGDACANSRPTLWSSAKAMHGLA